MTNNHQDSLYNQLVEKYLAGRFEDVEAGIKSGHLHPSEVTLLEARLSLTTKKFFDVEKHLHAFDKTVEPSVLALNRRLEGDRNFVEARYRHLVMDQSQELFEKAKECYLSNQFYVEGTRAFLNSLIDDLGYLLSEHLLRKVGLFEIEMKDLWSQIPVAEQGIIEALIIRQKVTILFQAANYEALVRLFDLSQLALLRLNSRDRLLMKLLEIDSKIFLYKPNGKFDLDFLEQEAISLVAQIKDRYLDLEHTLKYLLWRIGNLKEKKMREPFLWAPNDLASSFRARATYLADLSRGRKLNSSDDPEIKLWIANPYLLPEIRVTAKQLLEKEELFFIWKEKKGELLRSDSDKVLFRCRVGTKKFQVINKLFRSTRLCKTELMDDPTAASEAQLLYNIVSQVNKSVPGLLFSEGSDYSVGQKVKVSQ